VRRTPAAFERLSAALTAAGSFDVLSHDLRGHGLMSGTVGGMRG
jgi:alpha-beta hydrolase superfamily lysophospholipase